MSASAGRWTGLALGTLTALALFLLRSVELSADSLNELRAIAAGRWTSHPHHLLFAPIVGALHRMVAAVLPACDPILVAQAHGALWAGLSVAGATWILERELGSLRAAALWALALAASPAMLLYATEVEAYVPSAGCLVLLGALLLRARSGPATTLAAIALFALAVLYHQTAALFAAPLLVLVRRQAGGSRRWAASAAAVLGGAGALVFAVYAAASGARSPGGVVDFVLTYSAHPNQSWATWSNVSARGAFQLLRGQVGLLVHVPGAYSDAMVATVFAFALALAGLALLAVSAMRRRRLAPLAVAFPAAWLAAHWSFCLWFLPSGTDFLVETVFPLLLLAALVLNVALERPVLRRAGSLLGAMLLAGGAVWNVGSLALPRHRDPGPHYRAAAALARTGLVEGSFVLAEYDQVVQLTQRFGAGRHAFAEFALLRFYQTGDPPAVAPTLAGEERVLVPLRQVVPGHAVGPHTGWTDASGWLAFVRWVCDLRPAAGPRPASHARLELVETDLGERYLVVHPGQRVKGDLRALLSALDALAGGSQCGFAAAGAAEAGR